MQYRSIVSCAMYEDILKPPSTVSLSLQGYELDMVLGIKNILKSTTALKSLARQDPTVKLLLGKIKDEDIVIYLSLKICLKLIVRL